VVSRNVPGTARRSVLFVGRHLVPASLANWTVSNISGQLVNVAVPVAGFILASRRPENRIGWLFLVAGLALGLSGFSSSYALHHWSRTGGPCPLAGCLAGYPTGPG
jgi:hypothetical protein